MNDEMKQIKDLRVALKDMEPYVKDPMFLTQGVRFSNFRMLVREAWANWLLCVTLEHITGKQYTFQETVDGDGIIGEKGSGVGFQVEHVCAMDFPAGRQLPVGDARILWAINHKVQRGAEYARNKSLVVFFDGAGEFHRNKIRERIYGNHDFKVVFCIGLLTVSEGGYSYSVTEFRDSFGDKSLTHKVDIDSNFSTWDVSQVKE